MSAAPPATDGGTGPSSARQFANQVLDLIEQFGCVPTPRAYEVFFAYASNEPEDVRDQVDKATGPDQVLRSFDLERIYHDNFRSAQGEWERQEQSSLQVENSLADVIAVIDDHMTKGIKYGDSLQKASSQIAQSESAGDLRQIVDGLISETDAVLQAGTAASSALADQRTGFNDARTSMETARKDALTDPVTFLGNRQSFETELEVALKDAVINGRQLSFGLIDIDAFCKVNEEFDYTVGDAVLRSLGQLFTRRLSDQGMAFRYGGEEFALILPGQNARKAQELSEKLRKEIYKRKFVVRDTGAEIGQISVSVGLTALKSKDNSDDIVCRAMKMLSQAKAKGGNQIAMDGPLML
ncbi:MAG: GGDEF domain-containing protein [Pseudomonadota bacterium]